MADKIDTRKRPIEIFLIEDNLEDVVLMNEALKGSKLQIHLSVARDGEEALDHLHAHLGFSGRRNPDLILLDLNLPKKDGREVLAEIKEDPVLQLVPIVIMTSSKAPADLQSAYEHQANFFIVKPMNLRDFFGAVKYIEDFWLKNIA